MKKLLPAVAAACVLVFGYFALGANPPNELNLLIWDNYLAADTLANFEQQTDSAVITELFKSNEEALAKIKANPGVYDIVVPSDYMVHVLKSEGLLETLDATKIPSLKNISASMRKHYYDADGSVSVPYAYGTAGFAVNTTFVADETITWRALTEERFKGQIVLMDDMRFVLGSVLLELGLDPNTTKREDIDAAVALLKQVMVNVQKITPDTPVDLMAADGAWIAYGYSGDVFQMHDLNEAVEYKLPAFGALQFVDNLAIPVDAPHADLAHAFIEYILDPKASADITEATSYGNPNTAALAFISEELKSNPSVFLPEQSATKLHFIKDIGDDIALYDDAWQEIKR